MIFFTVYNTCLGLTVVSGVEGISQAAIGYLHCPSGSVCECVCACVCCTICGLVNRPEFPANRPLGGRLSCGANKPKVNVKTVSYWQIPFMRQNVKLKLTFTRRCCIFS